MNVDPGGSGGGSGSDPSFEGQALEFDPATFRGFGKNVAQIAQFMASDAAGVQLKLNGPGYSGAVRDISAGDFPPGQWAQALLNRNRQSLGDVKSNFLGDALLSLQAIASRSLVIGEVLERSEQANAARVSGVDMALLSYVTGNADAPRPTGMPAYVSGDTLRDRNPSAYIPERLLSQTVERRPDGLEAGGLMYIATYETPTGGRRVVTTAQSGERSISYYNSSGVLEQSQHVSADGLTKTTTTYDGNGNARVETQGPSTFTGLHREQRLATSDGIEPTTQYATYAAPDGGRREVTTDSTGATFERVYDAEGELVSAISSGPDGTTVTSYDSDGTRTTSTTAENEWLWKKVVVAQNPDGSQEVMTKLEIRTDDGRTHCVTITGDGAFTADRQGEITMSGDGIVTVETDGDVAVNRDGKVTVSGNGVITDDVWVGAQPKAPSPPERLTGKSELEDVREQIPGA